MTLMMDLEISSGDGKSKGDEDGKEKFYRLTKKINIENRLNIFVECDNIIDNHTIVLTRIGDARKKDIHSFFETYFERYAINCKDYIWGSWKINIVFDRYGKNRGIAYVYLKNKEMFHVLVGNLKNGERRTKVVNNFYYNRNNPSELPKKKGICYQLEEYIYIPDKRIPFEIPFIETGDNRKEERKILPHIVPCHIHTILKSNVLVSRKVPSWVTEKMIKQEISIFGENKVHINMTNNHVHYDAFDIYLTFSSNTVATFSLVMIKKMKIKQDEKFCYIFFGPLR
jgi:hypothetical protein